MPADSTATTASQLKHWQLVVRALRLAVHMAIGAGLALVLPLAGARASRLAGWWYRRVVHILGIRIETCGDPPKNACLIAANHVSWVDILLLGGLLEAAFLSKAEVDGWPLVGRFARATGTIFLPRGAGQTVAANTQVAAALGAGRSVILFPESTTNANLEPAHFHARLFASAIEAGVPVQPLAIHYLADDGGSGHHPLAPWVGEAGMGQHFRRLFRLPRLRVRITFCAPLATPGCERRALAQASHERIWQALQSAPEEQANRSA